MTPLVILALWCVVAVQQLYVGQKDRDIISPRKLIATAPFESVIVAQSVVDATGNTVVRFNTVDLNNAKPSNASVHINHAADTSTNKSESFVRGAPLIYNTAGTTEIGEYMVGVVVWILGLYLCLFFGYVSVTEHTLREKDNENALLVMEIMRINNELSRMGEMYKDILKRSTKPGEKDDSPPSTDPSNPPSMPNDHEDKHDGGEQTTGSNGANNGQESAGGGGEGSTDLNGADKSVQESPTNGGPSTNGVGENSSPSGGLGPEVRSPDDKEPGAPTTSLTTTSDTDSTMESRPHGSQSKSVLTSPSNNVHEDLRRLGVPPSGPKYM